MPRSIVYSTNTYLKLLIQERYFNDIHYVWCSDYFDSGAAPGYSQHALAPPSSDPADIYRRLKRDVDQQDKHSDKITRQKAAFSERAIECYSKGAITEDDKDEILFMVEDATFEHWRPLLYVIPYALVSARVKVVPIKNRASFGVEYIIADLQRNEFDIVEF